LNCVSKIVAADKGKLHLNDHALLNKLKLSYDKLSPQLQMRADYLLDEDETFMLDDLERGIRENKLTIKDFENFRYLLMRINQ
jgi:hypothetical protein